MDFEIFIYSNNELIKTTVHVFILKINIQDYPEFGVDPPYKSIIFVDTEGVADSSA